MQAVNEPSFASATRSNPSTSGAAAIRSCSTAWRRFTAKREVMSLLPTHSTSRGAHARTFSRWSIMCFVTPQNSLPLMRIAPPPRAGRAFGVNTNRLTIGQKTKAIRCIFRWMTRKIAGQWWLNC